MEREERKYGFQVRKKTIRDFWKKLIFILSASSYTLVRFEKRQFEIFAKYRFLGGLSLHLNHLIASRTANYDWPFGTLPFGLFWSNLDTRDLETYPRTYSGHF